MPMARPERMSASVTAWMAWGSRWASAWALAAPSLHGGLDDARHLGAVVFPVELVGQPPVRQGGELPDDVPKAGGEHGHGGVL